MTTTPLPIGVAAPRARAMPAPTAATTSATAMRRTTLLGTFRTIFIPSVVPAFAKRYINAAAIHSNSLENAASDLATCTQRVPQDPAVLVEPLPVEARLRASCDAHSFRDHAPNGNLLCLPPGDRLIEIVGA